MISLATLKSELPRFLGFALVGGGGFFVHAGCLFLLTHFTRMNAIAAWFPAFLAAVLFTWWLNRRLAFKGLDKSRLRKETAQYFMVQSLGAVINLIAYTVSIVSALPIISYPIVALAIGSIIAFGFNYIALRLFVYTGSA